MSRYRFLILRIIILSCLIIIPVILYKQKQIQSLIAIPTYTPTPANNTSFQTPTETITPTNIPTPEIPAGWQIYTNNAYHYSISFPSDWRINNTRANPNPQVYKGTYIILYSPEGNIFTFEYDYATVGTVPLHIYKAIPVLAAGEHFLKTYNDGCNFNKTVGIESPGRYDCTDQTYADRGIFQITYGLSKDVANDTIPEYTMLHGKYASLRFSFKKHVPFDQEKTDSFQQVDSTINKIVGSLTFSL